MLFRSWLLCILATMFSTCFAATLVPMDKTLPPFDLSKHTVKVEIKNRISYTTITQIYQNDTNRELEGMYVFPTPKGAKITEFSMWIAGKKMVGTVVERIKARRIYQAIVDSRRDPGILEQEKRNLFKVRVFPILPKSEQKFRIAYTQEIPYEAGEYIYRYPLAAEEDFPIGLTRAFSLKAEIVNKQPLSNPTVNGYFEHNITHKSKKHIAIEASYHNKRPQEDFIIRYSHKACNPLTIATAKDHALITITPSLDRSKVLPGKTVFCIDTSASMAKNEQLQWIKEGVIKSLEEMSETSSFNVLAFDQEVNFFSSKLVEAKKESKKKAKAFVKSLFPLGASNLEAVLKHIELLPSSTNVILITDGLANIAKFTDHSLNKLVKPIKAKLFTIAVGSKANQSLLQNIAEARGAFSQHVKEPLDLAEIIPSTYLKTAYPALTNIKFSCSGPGKLIFYPEIPTEIYAGSQICLFAKGNKKGSYTLKIEGQKNGQKIDLTENIEITDSKSDVFLEQYWEYHRIEHLLKEIRKNGESKALVDEVIRLSIKNQVVTPYTAYLVLETEKDYKRHQIDRNNKNKLIGKSLLGGNENNANLSAPEPGQVILWLLLLLALFISRYWISPQPS